MKSAAGSVSFAGGAGEVTFRETGGILPEPVAPPTTNAIKLALYVALWYGTSILFNIVNKQTLNAFPMPYAIATWQLSELRTLSAPSQSICAIMSCKLSALERSGLVRALSAPFSLSQGVRLLLQLSNLVILHVARTIACSGRCVTENCCSSRA